MSIAGINIPGIKYIESGNFLLIAGPCVVENEEIVFETADHLKRLSEKYLIPFVFKSSYRKANRSKGDSFSGIGDIKALKIIAEVRKKFGAQDTIFIMCRSGGRSAAAVNALAEAGFKSAYTVIDGFEGDTVEDSTSYFHGKRVRNGWKNSGAPWTYDLDPDLVYKKESR